MCSSNALYMYSSPNTIPGVLHPVCLSCLPLSHLSTNSKVGLSPRSCINCQQRTCCVQLLNLPTPSQPMRDPSPRDQSYRPQQSRDIDPKLVLTTTDADRASPEDCRPCFVQPQHTGSGSPSPAGSPDCYSPAHLHHTQAIARHYARPRPPPLPTASESVCPLRACWPPALLLGLASFALSLHHSPPALSHAPVPSHPENRGRTRRPRRHMPVRSRQ